MDKEIEFIPSLGYFLKDEPGVNIFKLSLVKWNFAR